LASAFFQRCHYSTTLTRLAGQLLLDLFCYYWLAKEISRVLKMGIPEGEDIDISLLEHVSPIEWENVILYGQYVLNLDDIR
jgi:hypothetical protein